MNDKQRPPAWIWRWTIGTIVLGWTSLLVVNSLRALHDILIISLVSLLAACALEKPVTALAAKGVRRGVATFAVLVGGLLVTIGVVALGGAVLLGQLSSLREASPELARNVAGWLNTIGFRIDANEIAAELSDQLTNAVQHNAGTLLLRASVMAGNIAIGALLVFYLVADGPRLRRNVCSLLPPARQQQVLDVWTAAIDKAGGYFVVRALLAAAATAASFVGFSLLGVPYALALSVWVGVVSQAIPAVGTYLAGALPVVVVAASSAEKTVLVLVFLVVYQQVENYLLSPRISRNVMSVHPAVAFIGAISGGVLAGVPGALIAIPIIATTQAVIAASVERHQLVESELFRSPAVTTKRAKGRTTRSPRRGRSR